jgi:predicted DNA-binding transcriptional regulator YafY
MSGENKGFRLLKIYERLNRGEIVRKCDLAAEFAASEKSIQRDIETLRDFLSEAHMDEPDAAIRYDRAANGYRLARSENVFLQNKEIMTVTKILLDSRALTKEEMDQLLDKLLLLIAPSDRKAVREIILNERFHYTPLTNAKPLLQAVWDIGELIRGQKVARLDYRRRDNKRVQRTIKPLALIFSEYYFYLIAYSADDDSDFPLVFRVDRIRSITAEGRQFAVVYKNRFEEGEFRKRIQFMHHGELLRIRLKYWGDSLEAVLDRLPTARVIERAGGAATLETEVFGRGIKMWLLSQMEFIEVLSPQSLRDDMRATIERMRGNYSDV